MAMDRPLRPAASQALGWSDGCWGGLFAGVARLLTVVGACFLDQRAPLRRWVFAPLWIPAVVLLVGLGVGCLGVARLAIRSEASRSGDYTS